MSDEKKLIYADDLLNAIRDDHNINGANFARIRRHIEAATAVDAVEVVRCLECKHFRHYGKTSLFINGKNIKAGWCQRRISYDEEYRMTADDFCSYGERKEGAD